MAMIIIACGITIMLIGYILLYLTYIIPIFRLMYMDWIAAIVISVPTFLFIIRLGGSKSTKIFEKKPVGKELVIWLRRDGTVIPSYASRPFYGESFLELPKVGIVHDLGKGSVYRWGDKNVRFALENVNHTPNPTFVNYTHWLYSQGFDNMSEVQEFINNGGKQPSIEPVPYTPVETMKKEILEYEKEKSFKPIVGRYEDLHRKVDSIIWKEKKPKP